MSRLTIIAGPNGAGKSTFSNNILKQEKIEAFDFDKEFYKTWKLFDYDPYVRQGVIESTAEKFQNQIKNSIKEKVNFAFETNYHTPTVLNVLSKFKSAGYHTELFFICLLDSDLAVERVKNRIASGGHTVDIDTIHERYIKGLELLNKSFKEYDSITLALSKHKDIDVLIHISDVKNKIITINKDLPGQFKSMLPSLSIFCKKDKGLII